MKVYTEKRAACFAARFLRSDYRAALRGAEQEKRPANAAYRIALRERFPSAAP